MAMAFSTYFLDRGLQVEVAETSVEAVSKLSFRPISASGPRFQSSKYGSIPVADPGATGAAGPATASAFPAACCGESSKLGSSLTLFRTQRDCRHGLRFGIRKGDHHDPQDVQRHRILSHQPYSHRADWQRQGAKVPGVRNGVQAGPSWKTKSQTPDAGGGAGIHRRNGGHHRLAVTRLERQVTR